jgi:hypothetical protein
MGLADVRARNDAELGKRPVRHQDHVAWCVLGGAQDYLLFQGGTAKADAEARRRRLARSLLAFLDDATKVHGS